MTPDDVPTDRIRYVQCPRCLGSGYVRMTSTCTAHGTCPRCAGFGQLLVPVERPRAKR